MKVALQWTFLAFCNVVLAALGLFCVAFGVFVPVPGVSVSDGRPIVNLPNWLWIWGNDFDGLDGDKRGWWAENTPWGWPVTSRRARWWWAAIRNPVNNMRRLAVFSCPIAECTFTYRGKRTVEDKPGLGGWQFVTASNSEREWYGFYYVHEVLWNAYLLRFLGKNPRLDKIINWMQFRAFVVRAGFKIKPDHEGSTDEPKGFTFKINPWKSI